MSKKQANTREMIMSNQLTVFDLVGGQEELFLPVISDHSIKWEKEKQFAIQALQNNDYLTKIAFGNPVSLQNSIINVASIGISLNPALKHAYLVPRKGGVCLDLSYMGLLHLAQSSGVILWGQSKLVYNNDTYENNGLSKEPTHKTTPFGDRGEIVGVYCTVKTIDGDYLTDEMSIADVFAIRDRSEAFKKGMGPWKTDHGEMIRKTIVKRAYKYWPKCERLGEAIQVLNDNGEGIDFGANHTVDITPINESQFNEIETMCTQKGRTQQQLCEWASKNFKRDIKSLDELYSSEFKITKNMVANS